MHEAPTEHRAGHGAAGAPRCSAADGHRAVRLAIDCRHRFGVGTLVRNLVPRLAAHVDELTLLGSVALLREWNREVPNVKLVPFDARVYGVAEQLRFPYGLARKVDLLHVPSYNVPLVWRAPLATTINDLAHLSGAMPTNVAQRSYARLLIRQAIRRSRALVTLSEFSRREIARTFGVPPEGITVVPCGVDPAVFHPPEAGAATRVAELLGTDASYILTAGSLRPHKNTNALLLAFQDLKRRYGIPHHLVVVGEQRGFRVNTPLVRLAPDVERVTHFTGVVSDEMLGQLYGCCGAFVYPSLYEGFGLPPLEAMACGAAVVASNRASLPEVVGDAGVLVDPTDVVALADATYGVIADGGRGDRMRRQGLARASTFSWDKSAAAYLEVFRRCVGDRRVRAA